MDYLSICLYTAIYLSISYNIRTKNREFISKLKRNKFEEEKISPSSLGEINFWLLTLKVPKNF